MLADVDGLVHPGLDRVAVLADAQKENTNSAQRSSVELIVDFFAAIFDIRFMV
jgi:hypothetical protein